MSSETTDNTADSAPTTERTTKTRTIKKRTIKTRTRGGQVGNSNRVMHGLRSASIRLALGTLPKSMRRVEIDARDFREALEAAVSDRHGEIDLTRACLIATAAAWQRHSALCVRWLREHEATMTHSERLAYSREIATAASNRDKTIAALRLTRTAEDAIAALYAAGNQDEPQDQSTDSDVAAGNVANDTGNERD